MSLVGLSQKPARLVPDHPERHVPSPLVPVVAAAAIGIVADRWQGELLADAAVPRIECAGWWLTTAGALLGWCWLQRLGRPITSGLVLLLAIASLAGGWHHWHWWNFAHHDLGRFAADEPRPCCVEVVALASPQRVAAPPESPFRAIPQVEKSQLPIRIVRLRNGERWTESSGRCELVVDGHLLGVAANDRLRVFGQLRRPGQARNPGQFDFAAHARADRQLCYLRSNAPECVSVVQRSTAWSPVRAIDHVRRDWQARLWTTLGPDRAPMAAAILIGTRNSLPREHAEAFRRSGALHVLVVSGLHAGILVSILFIGVGLGLLPRRLALALAMLAVAAYAVLTGAHPPVIRAAVLAELACLALWFHRNPFALNSLACAGLVVLAMNPADLFRSGPQLSFLCVAILLWFSSVPWRRRRSPLETLLYFARPWYARLAIGLGQKTAWTIAATLAVWVASLPLLMYQFHLVTPVAVLIAPLLFPVLALTLLSGFAMLVLGWLVPVCEPPLAAICRWSVTGLDGLVSSASSWPLSHFWTPSPPAWWVLGWYLLAGGLLYSGGTRFGWRRTVQWLAVWVVMGAVPVVARRATPDHLRLAFLDVGHGVCAVLTTPDGKTLLYDAGSLGSPSFATETIAGYLWSRGIRSIDGVVLSHPDVDHFNALPGLLERFPIDRVFVSPHMFPRRADPLDSSAPAELRRLLDRHAVPVETIELGDRLVLDAATEAVVLFPDRIGAIGSDNANSVVLAIESGPYRVLLPGDLESPGLDAVMADPPYDCDILLAPHHGSSSSDPPGFAAWSRPEYVVVSGNSLAARRELADSYGRRGATLLLTRESGAIEFRLTDPLGVQKFCAR